MLPSPANTHDGVRLKWQYSDDVTIWNTVSLGALRRRGMQWRRQRRPKTHVRPAMVEMGYPWFQNELQVALIQGMKKSRHSRRRVPPKRSHMEFAFGARTGVRNRTPIAVTLWSNSLEKMLSWSWRTNRYE